ncbi:MAG: TMEM165/GDT1 family protein [Magnetospirillum sp. WYHS-4]
MFEIAAVFASVFLAELGDKTQLATVLFASEGKHHPFAVFLAAAGALVASTALAVLVGTAGAKYIEGIPLKLIAGIGFILLGAWTVIGHFRGA